MSSVFLYEPFYDIERLVDHAFGSKQRQPSSNAPVQNLKQSESGAIRSLKPRMDLHEDKEKNIVTANFEFPGVPKEDIHIDVQDGKLSVSAESKQTSEHDENGYAVRERRFGKYARVLQLPRGIKDEEIKATMANGVLTITFPKLTPEQQAKRISID